jgi:phage baseplate assembly protein V
MSREAIAEHDRMIGAMIIPGHVVEVDLETGKVRIDSRGWVSPWVRWHSIAAGQARHWRAPSLNEQGTLICPSGVPSLGVFVPGLYSEAGAAADNRDHVEVWRFEDGGSLVYDWKASSYDITLPAGTATIKVGASVIKASSGSVSISAGSITLSGTVTVNGPLTVTGDVSGLGKILDAGGNSANHVH